MAAIDLGELKDCCSVLRDWLESEPQLAESRNIENFGAEFATDQLGIFYYRSIRSSFGVAWC